MEDSQFIFNPAGRLPIEELSGIDIGVVQRLMHAGNLKAIQMMKGIGMKVVFDLDDHLWDIPSYNPAKKVLEQYKEGLDVCASHCDLITVSTAPLKATVQRQLGSKIPIKVLRNCIDLNLFHPLPDVESEEVVVGWGGSITHSGDTKELFSVIPDVLEKNKNMVFEVIGQKLDASLMKDRVRQGTPVAVSEYPARLASWRWDVFLAPLLDNAFNRSKSSLKMIEAGALKRPCLASPVAPYKDLVALDSELKWLICETKQQWKTKLTELVNSKEQRQYYGNRLYDLVNEHFNIEKNIKYWKEAYASI